MPERRLRVALVNQVARLGGAEFSLLAIAEYVDRRSIELVVVLGEDGPLVERLRAVSVDVVVHPLDRSVLDRRKDALGPAGLANPLVLARACRAVIGLARLFRKREIDVVHTNNLKAHVLAGLGGRLAGARVVWHVRDHLSSPYLPAAVVPFVRLAARTLPHRVIAVSASAARTVGRRDVVVLHEGVPIPADAPERPPGAPPRVGIVGRIAPWKGQDVFLAAVARIAPEFPEAEFALAGAPLFGEESFEQELRRQAASLGLEDRVHFLGFREDVWSVYRELDVVVHASTQPEPYGKVVLETMASRRTLVAAAAGGVLELVDDGRTGLLVAPGDVDALACALARLLRSPEERRRLADAGRRHVEDNFSLERDAGTVERIWREVRLLSSGNPLRTIRGARGRGGVRYGGSAMRFRASSWRQPSRVLLAPLRPANYRTLVRSGLVFPKTVEMLRRYVFNDGDYPYAIPIRTPQGRIAPTLYSLHDIRTANEVFCREDYRDPGNSQVVVDIGANIGLSALYFLSRSATCRVYCYEPSPVNIPRLRHNLSAYDGRMEIHERAVAERAGELDFAAEPTGRYGAIVREGDRPDPASLVRVRADDINSVLEAVLEREGHIDVLKIDTEGSELPIIEAVRPDLQRRITRVYLEAEPKHPIHSDVFEQRQLGSICRLTARTCLVVCGSGPRPTRAW